MSSYIMHICISDRVKRKLNLTHKFIYGSVLPDVIKNTTGDRTKSHYINRVIIDGDERSLPNVQKAIEELTIEDKEIYLGYIAHLIEDLIWSNDFKSSYILHCEGDKIKFLNDNSIHSRDEYRNVMYAEYINVSNYVVYKCGVDISKLLPSIINISQDEEYKKIILDNTRYMTDADIAKNIFMTKESIDKYIEVCTSEVEKIISMLMGE